MKTQPVSIQSFNGTFIYDKSLSARQIGMILKTADKKILAKKNYNIRFKQSYTHDNVLVISAESGDKSKSSEVFMSYEKEFPADKLLKKITEAASKYEWEYSAAGRLMDKISDFYKKSVKSLFNKH